MSERLAHIRSNAPEPNDHRAVAEYFGYRKTEAWFGSTIAKYAKHIEHCVAQNRTWEAVSFAIDLGMLVTELAYKQDLDRAALVGKAMLDMQGAPAKARRKQPAEERIAYVEQMKATGKVCARSFRSLPKTSASVQRQLKRTTTKNVLPKVE